MSALDDLFRQLARDGPRRGRTAPLAHVDPALELPDDVIVEAGAWLPAGVVIGPGCRIGAHAVFADGAATVVGRDVQIGAHATLEAGITIGAGAVVRPGAVVLHSVPPRAIVEGHPAVVVGRIDDAVGAGPQGRCTDVEAMPVRGVALHRLAAAAGGRRVDAGFRRDIPFEPASCTIVSELPDDAAGGGQARRSSGQFLICLRGRCIVTVDDGRRRAEVVLDAPQLGLYLPPLTWSRCAMQVPDAMLLIFSSQPQAEPDAIDDRDAFLAAVG